MNTKILLILAMSIFSNNLFAQDTPINPKNNPFDPKYIETGTTEMVWYMVQDTLKIEIGKVKTDIQKKEDDLYVITTVDLKQSPMKWVDSTIAKVNNLKPVYHSSYNMQRDMALRFSEQVTGYYFDKQTHTKTSILELTSKPYFDSNIYPQLIRWLPLKEGYTGRISIFDYNPATKTGTITATIKNVEAGTILIKGVEKQIWKVTVTDDITDNKAISIYYIDRETRKLLKQEIKFQGRTMLMELKQ